MTTLTKKQETENSIIEIKLTRKVYDSENRLDGSLISTDRKVYESYEVKITSKKSGKSIWKSGKPGDFAFFTPANGPKLPAGAVARIGDAYIGQGAYDICMAMIAELDAELTKSEEQIAIEITEANREANRVAKLEAWRNSPEGKADLEAMKSHERLMRNMDRANSDY